MPEKNFEAVQPYFGPQNMYDTPSSNTDKILCEFSLMKPGTKQTKKKKCKFK